MIKPRRKDSNKGSYGHVLVVAGSKGMTGAPALCARGALRGGSGLVTAAVPAGEYRAVAGKLRPEAMLLPTQSFTALKKFIVARKVSVVAVGPGLGAGSRAKSLVKQLFLIPGLRIVADADALNALAGESGAFRNAKAELIITPHPGEMGRLVGKSVKAVQAARTATAKAFAEKNRLVCALKGSGTVVTDGKKVFVNTTGNPGMATGGSGDVLAGLTAALWAQVREPAALNAAAAAVYIHGLAGDIAAQKKTMVGMTAGDIAEALPAALRKTRIR